MSNGRTVWQTADGRRQTADGRRQTADGRPQTADRSTRISCCRRSPHPPSVGRVTPIAHRDAWPLVILEPLRKLILIVLIVTVAIAAVRQVPLATLLEELQRITRDAGTAGYVIYALGYGVTALVIPASVLTIGAGALFGIVGGTLVVVSGATLAASLAFLIARTVGRGRLQRIIDRDPRYGAVDRAIEKEGAKIVLLVRLAAVFPFLVMNYVFGLTSVRFLPYLAATAAGILPGTIAFVTIGATGAAAAAQDRTRLAFTISGLIVAFTVSIFVARVATKAIREAGVGSGPQAGKPGGRPD